MNLGRTTFIANTLFFIQFYPRLFCPIKIPGGTLEGCSKAYYVPYQVPGKCHTGCCRIVITPYWYGCTAVFRCGLFFCGCCWRGTRHVTQARTCMQCNGSTLLMALQWCTYQYRLVRDVFYVLRAILLWCMLDVYATYITTPLQIWRRFLC